MRTVVLFGLLCGCCGAQQWELGAAAGYGIYRNGTVYGPDGGKATAGFRNRFIVSFWLGEDLYRYVSGEFRYVYHDGHPFLSGQGQKVDLNGHSHVFSYDVLVYARPRESRIRPYFAIGGGAKEYVVNGPANPNQPLRNIAALTVRNELTPLISAGVGVKINVAPRVILRFDFRDYASTFPKRIIAPAEFGTARGMMQQFTSMAGIGLVF